jgi:succinoglycan biosynthesis transport protein ExoP
VVTELSLIAADEGTRVIVIDTVASHAGRDGPGLSDLVAGEAAFGDIIHRNDHTRAHEIGVGTVPLDPSLLDAEMLETMLSALESAYDLVLLALGDMEADDVRFRMVVAADHAVLIGHPEDPRVARACRVLAASGIGAVSVLPPDQRPDWGAAA